MKKLLVYSAALAFSCCGPLPALAECVTAANATAASDCVVLEQNGVRGVWFELKLADEMRRTKSAYPELQLQVGLLEQRAAVRDFQMERYLEVIKLKDAAIAGQQRELESQVRLARASREEAEEARAALNAWWRQPSLWFAAGVTVTVATSALIVGFVN